jgi:DNA invertase Pin-like site-specific DNA recombinase
MAATTTAVYLRQSKDSEGKELAIARQREDCLELCKQRGWTDTQQYPDNDRSATNGKPRPKYQQMLKDIQAGKITRVVVWDLDRLHRQPIELEYFMRLADQKQLGLATVTGEVDLSTDNGRLFARIKGAVGMAEVERKSARQKRAAEQRAKDGGRPWWPSRPFGFDADPDPQTGKWITTRAEVDPDTGKVVKKQRAMRLHPKEAKLLRNAYRDFNAGSSLRSIAARWNEAGVKTTRGNMWSGTRVRELLMLARNAGLRELRGEVVGEGDWPAIVSEETWRKAHRVLTQPSRRSGPYRGRKYLLSGIARCGREGCGGLLTSYISSRGQRKYACLRCHKLSRDGVMLDELITERVVWRLAREDAVKLLLPDEPEVDTESLREQRRALEDKLEQLGEEFADAPPAFTQAALKDVKGRLDEIDAALEDPEKVNIYEGVIGAKDVRKAFLGLDLGRQRTIVDALMTITVNPVGKGARVFDPDSIDRPWKKDL